MPYGIPGVGPYSFEESVIDTVRRVRKQASTGGAKEGKKVSGWDLEFERRTRTGNLRTDTFQT